MSMEFSTSRRVVTTYGRPTKRVLVHNLFSSPDAIVDIADVRSDSLVSPPITTYIEQALQRPSDIQTTSTRDEPSIPPPAILRKSRVRQEHDFKAKAARAKPQDDVFAVGSSEDDAHGAKVPVNLSKKQRLARSTSTNSAQATKSVAKLSSTTRNDGALSGPSTMASRLARVASNSKTQKPKQPTATLAMDADETPDAAEIRRVPSVRSISPVNKFGQSFKLSNGESPSDQETRTVGDQHLRDHTIDDVPASSPDSAISISTLAKRKRTPLPRATPEPISPSVLGLTPLKLTPDGSDTASVRSSPGPTIVAARKTHRARPRLVDRLDAPSESQTSELATQDNSLDSALSNSAALPAALHRGRPKKMRDGEEQQPRSAKDNEQSGASQARATYATKARTTYAKERSHLTDMVDGLEMSGGSSGSQQYDRPMWKTTTSNLASQLDLDDENSDDQVSTKPLKSIHELRQAGAMNRFDREIQALLEDIEMSQGKKKAVRLPALAKLAVRLGDESFIRHFLSSNRLTRLTECARNISSALEGVPYAIGLYYISRSTNEVDTLAQVLEAIVMVAPRMLLAYKSLDDLIVGKDVRNPKTDTKELANLELDFFRRGLMSAYGATSIFPDGLVLTCLDELFKKSMQIRGQGMRTPITVYSGIMKSLERYARQVKAGRLGNAHAFLIGKALSVLEMCSLGLDAADSSIEDEQYLELGESLSVLNTGVVDDDGETGRAVLRVVISLSNNNAEMCGLLGKTSIISTIFGVVNIDFGIIAEHADHHQEVDQKRLDSVILALGCLLNFAECDGDCRRRLAFGITGTQSYVERLVTLFNSQIAKAQEATTQEEGQVLVAFGYLSMLLCMMSLDPEVRRRISQYLQDRSFEDLCAAAELFFSHLRTLENISEDDPSMKRFTDRFSVILKSIRSAVAQA